MGIIFRRRKGSGKKSPLREWIEAVVFALILVSLVRVFLFDLFAVPTSSMESTILPGDFLLVNKLTYGPRFPITPLTVPFSHQKLPYSEGSSYSDIVQFPFWRIPGLSEVEYNDVIVFNYPPEEEHPVDHRTYFVKRCIGLPGDTLELKSKSVYINGNKQKNASSLVFNYTIRWKEEPESSFFDKYHISNEIRTHDPKVWIAALTMSQVDAMGKDFRIASVEPLVDPSNGSEGLVYPQSNNFSWSLDQFGPLYIPKAGDSIELTETNIVLYGKLIENHEEQQLEWEDDMVWINGEARKHYVFRMNYFFAMGDNRDDSSDSRFWGLVPENHLVGKVSFIIFSKDNKSGVRWSRIFQTVN